MTVARASSVESDTRSSPAVSPKTARRCICSVLVLLYPSFSATSSTVYPGSSQQAVRVQQPGEDHDHPRRGQAHLGEPALAGAAGEPGPVRQRGNGGALAGRVQHVLERQPQRAGRSRRIGPQTQDDLLRRALLQLGQERAPEGTGSVLESMHDDPADARSVRAPAARRRWQGRARCRPGAAGRGRTGGGARSRGSWDVTPPSRGSTTAICTGLARIASTASGHVLTASQTNRSGSSERSRKSRSAGTAASRRCRKTAPICRKKGLKR